MDRRPRSLAAQECRCLPEPLVEALLELEDSGIVLLDPERRVARMNPEARRLLGIARSWTREIPGSHLLRTVIAGDDPLAEAYQRTALEREAVLHTKAGEVPVLL